MKLKQWEKDFKLFTEKMKAQIVANMAQKGESWKDCSPEFLRFEMNEHEHMEHWPDVANFAFMLWNQTNQSPVIGKQSEDGKQ
jgi:hypothetical protein